MVMKRIRPFKLRVDWFLQSINQSRYVTVELWFMGRDNPWVIHREETAERAVDWAVAWLRGRGFSFWCDIDGHQARNDTHITLHPRLTAVPPEEYNPNMTPT